MTRSQLKALALIVLAVCVLPVFGTRPDARLADLLVAPNRRLLREGTRAEHGKNRNQSEQGEGFELSASHGFPRGLGRRIARTALTSEKRTPMFRTRQTRSRG